MWSWSPDRRKDRQHVRNGYLEFRPTKTARRKKGELQAIPIIPAPQSIIDQSPCGDLTFTVTEFCRPFTVAGFGNWFRHRCDEAGLTGRSAHGLRKALQTIGAEDGLTDRELMALAGHERAKRRRATRRNRDHRALAASGMAKLAEGRFKNETVPPGNSSEKRDSRGRKRGKNRARLASWCPGAESNHRHCDFQSHALPTELPGRGLGGAPLLAGGL